jgi:hypothetical protein
VHCKAVPFAVQYSASFSALKSKLQCSAVPVSVQCSPSFSALQCSCSWSAAKCSAVHCSPICCPAQCSFRPVRSHLQCSALCFKAVPVAGHWIAVPVKLQLSVNPVAKQCSAVPVKFMSYAVQFSKLPVKSSAVQLHCSALQSQLQC